MVSLTRLQTAFCCTGIELCRATHWALSCPSTLRLTSPLHPENLAAALQQEGNARSRRAPCSSPLSISCGYRLLCCNSGERYPVIKLPTTMDCRAKNKADTTFLSSRQSTQVLPPDDGCLIFPAPLSWRRSFQRLV